MKNTLLFSAFCFVANMVLSQSFRQMETITVKPGLIITSGYQVPEHCGLALKSEIDMHNPYSFIIILQDESEKYYQILYQTDFSGKLTFLTCSQSLSESLRCKPFAFCCSCIRKIENFKSEFEKTDSVIECFMQHLNNCYNG